MSHPLDDVFEVSQESALDDMLEIHIPEDPTLDTIIDLALRAYKEQMEDVIHIEPKNRARYLEVAEKFLNQAKDAMAKKEQLKTLREKATQKNAPVATAAAAPEEPETVDRNAMYDRMKLVKK